jgi:hypothetical protein
MLRISLTLLIAISIALFVPKRIREALGILGILGVLAALWAFAVLVIVLTNFPAPQQ